ncbi:B3 domain-containing protein Os03g0622100-like isoform X2 [Phalaenopsis equestris]|uniref:B3 domain-containing protein Os03g0622100-like isoform X2 n=1 Tax=Phalaenopsis equestris TaxID=78828 RepID=UPI0009E4A48F|nr:B3 domain-containing protein Os03g0622100-like isoform X2 [Phalaenopsis equestris]
MSCQFVKFMGQHFSQMLTFPMNFMMNFEQLAEVITLEGPSGNQWPVRFSYIGDHIYLNEGWKEFVEANYVEEGDCLAFEYCGSSCFSVLIFDPSGCEREASYFARIMNPIPAKGCQAEEKRDNQVPDVPRFSSPRLPCVDNSPMQLVSNYEKSSAFNVKFDGRRFEHAIQSKMVEERSAM